jgi:hypothetical protein
LTHRTFRVRHENIIPEDKEHVLNTYDKGVDRWMTRNEAPLPPDEAEATSRAPTSYSRTIQQIPIEDASAAPDR